MRCFVRNFSMRADKKMEEKKIEKKERRKRKQKKHAQKGKYGKYNALTITLNTIYKSGQ